MSDVGAGGAWDAPVPFARFHDDERVERPDAASAVGFFGERLSAS